MDIPSILNHLGEEHELYFNAVAPPVIQSSNFCYKTVDDFRKAIAGEDHTPTYTRGYNPTVAMLRKKLAALEKAEDALVFGSGVAAITASVMSVVKAGDHAICVQKPYSWANALFNKYLINYGVSCTMVDGRYVENFEKAIKPNTKLIYLESPNSITFELQDIAAVSALAHKHNIAVVIDNSYCSPIYQNPIELGADLVVHSASKYLGGHSDMVAGVVCGSKERIHSMFEKEFLNLGGIISPHDAWLMLRSLRTLQLRVEKAATITPLVVAALESHPKIEKIYYPFSKNNPQYELAKKQMKGSPGLFSLILKTDIKGVERFCDNLKRFLMAVSWGGHESLVIPFCALSEEARKNSMLPHNLIRFFIGIDEAEYVIADILQALDKI